MRRFACLKNGFLALGCLIYTLVPAISLADAGSGGHADACLVVVGPSKVHFAAYQPQASGTTEFCDQLPAPGDTILVFDYEGLGAHRISVEFEVIKQPGGDTVFSEAPKVFPTGTANFRVNFPEPGNYLAHIAIVDAGGNKVDSHVPITVGAAKSGGMNGTLVVGVILIAGILAFYLSHAGFKSFVDRLTRSKASQEV